MEPAYPAARPKRRLRGCLLGGCLAVLVLALIPPLLLWAVAEEGLEITIPDGARDWQEVDRAHPLAGAAEAAPALPEAQATGATGEGALPEASPGASPAGTAAAGAAELGAVAGAGRGRIVFDVSMAELELVPVPAGTPLRLVARYDQARFELDESLREEGGDWTYDLRLRSRGWRSWWNNHGAGARLRLEVPRGTPVSLEGELGLGESRLELGGLALDAVDLELGAGNHEITFSEPTAGAMALLRLESAMGELSVLGAGNGSPREIDIDHGMGELELDLGGRWRNDGRVDLELGMGDCNVALPGRDEAVGIIAETSVGMGHTDLPPERSASAVAGLPRVSLHASGGMGNLRVR